MSHSLNFHFRHEKCILTRFLAYRSKYKNELSAVKSKMAAKDSAVVDDVTIIMIEVQSNTY